MCLVILRKTKKADSCFVVFAIHFNKFTTVLVTIAVAECDFLRLVSDFNNLVILRKLHFAVSDTTTFAKILFTFETEHFSLHVLSLWTRCTQCFIKGCTCKFSNLHHFANEN